MEGVAKVGNTLTAKVTPENATVTYQWQRADAADDTFENITGATNSTYTLTNEDADKYIRVVVTGTGSYTGTKTSAAVGPVAVVPIEYASTEDADLNIEVDFGTSVEDAIAALAKTIGVTGSKGETGTATITWTIADYDGNKAGEYTATGVLTLPEGWTGSPADVTATVTVKAEAVASTYKFSYTVPGNVIAGESYTVPVTIEPETVGDFSYDSVRFNVVVTTPDGATLQLLATDTNGIEHNVADIGYWGPSTGFPIEKDYTATTEFTAIFSDAGEYTITFSLVDLSGEVPVTLVTETVSILVAEADTTPPAITMTAGEPSIKDGKVTLAVTTKNTGADYENARYGIKVNVADVEGDTISISYGEGLTFNLNRVEDSNDFIGYFGPADGFTITKGWDVTTTFTVDFGPSSVERTVKVDAWVGQAPTPAEDDAVAKMDQVEVTIPAVVDEVAEAIAAVNDATTTAEMQSAIEAGAAVLGLDLTDYNKLIDDRKPSVSSDLLSNKPAEGYDQATLTDYFNAMVATRLVTQASMDQVNNAETVADLDGISWVTMLKDHFDSVTYAQHSDTQVADKIAELEALVSRYNALDEDEQGAVLQKVFNGIPYARSQATLDALAEALTEVEEGAAAIEAALKAVNDYLTPGSYVYAEAPGALEGYLATLGLDVGPESDYAKLETDEHNRKTAVFYDLNNNKPAEGYDQATLTDYFNAMVATRLVTQASMDLVNNAKTIEELNGISFVTMLLERFQKVSYQTHSDIPVTEKITTLGDLVTRYNALGEAGQKAVLAKIIEKRPEGGYARSQATTDALDGALTEVETGNCVVNITLCKSYDTIQKAIDAADEVDTIVVAAGTFSEELTINKSLTILGVNADNDARTDDFLDEGTVVTGGIRITGGDVTLNGLTIETKGILASNITGLTVINNKITDISEAMEDSPAGSIIGLDVMTLATGQIVINKNRFSNIGEINGTGTAVRMVQAKDSITITDNIIENVTKNGINLYTNCLANENAKLTITGNEIANWDSDKDQVNPDGGEIGGRAIRIDFAGANTTATADITGNKLIPPVYPEGQTPIDSEYVKLTAVDINVDLTKNYWGSASPAFGTILSVKGTKAAECAYVPYYTDEAMATLAESIEPEVIFTFTGLDDVTAGTVDFTITTKVMNNGAIANNIPLRYKAVVTKDSSALAGQAIKYPEAGDNWPAEFHTFTTDAEGTAYFGPSTGFTLTQLPELLTAGGVTTPFQADFTAGSYSVTVSLLDVSEGKEKAVQLGSSGTKGFAVAYPAIPTGSTTEFDEDKYEVVAGELLSMSVTTWFPDMGAVDPSLYENGLVTLSEGFDSDVVLTLKYNDVKIGDYTLKAGDTSFWVSEFENMPPPQKLNVFTQEQANTITVEATIPAGSAGKSYTVTAQAVAATDFDDESTWTVLASDQATVEVKYPVVTSLTMSADNVAATTGEKFTMTVTTQGTVADADKNNLVRFYGVISGLAVSNITFESIPGGTPAVVTDATERGYTGANEGDLVLAWGPAGGFPLGGVDYSDEGATTNFEATITEAGTYTVTFVFYDITAGKQLNAAGETATITVTPQAPSITLVGFKDSAYTGETNEFTMKVEPGSYGSTKVMGKIEVATEDVNSFKLEFLLNEPDHQWHGQWLICIFDAAADGKSVYWFGPKESGELIGDELGNVADTDFKVTWNEAGTYEFTASIMAKGEAGNFNEVLAFTDYTVKVEELTINPTFSLGSEQEITGAKQALQISEGDFVADTSAQVKDYSNFIGSEEVTLIKGAKYTLGLKVVVDEPAADTPITFGIEATDGVNYYLKDTAEKWYKNTLIWGPGTTVVDGSGGLDYYTGVTSPVFVEVPADFAGEQISVTISMYETDNPDNVFGSKTFTFIVGETDN